MMHIVQEKLLELSKKENLALLTLREMGKKIGLPTESPQRIKHHLLQLQKKGFLNIDRVKGVMDRPISAPKWAEGLLDNASKLFSLPIIGTANCGPATIFAEKNFQGFLRVSSKLIKRSNPKGLYAIKADGSSMNRAEINGKRLEDGDFAVIDSKDINARDRDIVLVIIDGTATIKRFIKDEANDQVVLRADSSFDYEPIYLHSGDNFIINGKVISVIKKPKN